jgi:hypothetical protein
MVKTSIETILVFVPCVTGFTQNQKIIDSLHHRLAMAKDDHRSIHAQADLCSVYRLGNTDPSVYHGQMEVETKEGQGSVLVSALPTTFYN